MMLNLVPIMKEITGIIRDLEDKWTKEKAEIDNKYSTLIEKYKKTIEVLAELNEACEYCEGKGMIPEKVIQGDPYGTVNLVACRHCSGTGIKPSKRELKKERGEQDVD